MNFDNSRSVNAQQQAYAYLRAKIFAGELRGGMRLNPEEIAKTLGLSRMPVREALRQLDAEGYVVMRPNRGAVVTQLTIAEIEDLFEMRAALEGLAVRHAMPHFTKDVFYDLNVIKDAMDRASQNAPKWIKLHGDFHQFICDLGKRSRLAQEINRLRQAVQPYLLIHVSAYEAVEMADREHAVLIQALLTGDPKVAEESMQAHILEASKRIVKVLSRVEAREKADETPVARAREDIRAQV
jgi:DNA-binding GntR family transcriptional regulator